MTKWSKRTIAIDFGTKNLRIADSDQGIVFQKPSVIALNPKRKEVVAIGEEAEEMWGRNPKGLVVSRPVSGGKVSQYLAAEALLRKAFQISFGKLALGGVELAVAVPANINSVEKRALLQILAGLGSKEIYLVSSAAAAALGAELDISQPQGKLSLDLGAGTCELSLLTMAEELIAESYTTAGDKLDAAIQQKIEENLGVKVSLQEAERLKRELANSQKSLSVTGQVKGFPQQVEIDKGVLEQVIKQELRSLVEAIRTSLAKIPPEVSADLAENGMLLSGGGQQLAGLDDYLTQAIGIPLFTTEHPRENVVKGLGVFLQDVSSYRALFK